MTTPSSRHSGLSVLLLFVAVWTLAGCGLVPENVSVLDPRIQPLLRAMDEIDRAGFGFTPVTTNAQIKLEIASGRAYDAMLHVYGQTSPTIAFRKTASGYRWTFEQESHQGPGWYQTVDGTFREYILVEYQTDRVDGIPTNQLWIRYMGSDTNLTGRELTLDEIRPILAGWRNTPVEPQPPDLPGAGFDPAPAMFVLFMLLALLVACCLGLVIAGACLGIVAILVGVGMISTSVLIGFLRRSVSAGFRVLFLQMGALAGLLGGAVATSAITLLTKSTWNSPLRWITGVTLGLLTGLLFGWLFNKAWSRIAQRLTTRLEASRK